MTGVEVLPGVPAVVPHISEPPHADCQVVSQSGRSLGGPAEREEQERREPAKRCHSTGRYASSRSASTASRACAISSVVREYASAFTGTSVTRRAANAS